jgi:hypothetical protein
VTLILKSFLLRRPRRKAESLCYARPYGLGAVARELTPGRQKSVTAMVQLDVGDHRMIEASETEIAQFAVVVLERSVTGAVADHVTIDLLNHGVHSRRRYHSSPFAANRRLPNWRLLVRQTSSAALPFTDGGGRTHTSLRTLDFESSASANSATSAYGKSNLT